MRYQNPIIRGFNPDPSICRVGDDYYLVTSSFEYTPGIPIYHSKDLVNWEQVGNCVTRKDQVDMTDAKDSGGIWAPTLRYHKGIFYVTATVDGIGNFIMETEDILGEWSDPVWVEMGGIDPSIYFEGDEAYYCTNYSLHAGVEEITAVPIDVHTGKLLGDIKTLWTGTGGGYLEAPHIYKVGDWYYLFAAEGGTNFNHMETVARSHSLWGPYEDCPIRPILSNAWDTTKQVQCSGHADLLEDHRGNWWMVHLGIRLSRRTMSVLGRETFLMPVTWKNGWPYVSESRRCVIEAEGPLWEKQKKNSRWRADFFNETWEPQWIWLRNRDERAKRGNGMLQLHPVKKNDRSGCTHGVVGVRPMDFACEVGATFSFLPQTVGEEAGMILYLASDFHYRIGKEKRKDGMYLVMIRTAEDMVQTVLERKIGDGILSIRIQTGKEKDSFWFQEEGKEWEVIGPVSNRFLSCEVSGRCFTGMIIGLYAWAKEKTDSEVCITEFYQRRVEEKDTW